jgi:hypothetical protein
VNVAPYELCEEFQTMQEAMEREWNCGVSITALPLADWCVARLAPLTSEQRIEQLIRWDHNNAAEASGISSEIQRLEERRRGAKKRAEMVREYLMGCMLTAGLKKLKTPIGTVSICAGRERVLADPEKCQFWPAEVYNRCVSPQPDKIYVDVLKREFGDRLKDLPGVSLECGDDYLMIR